MAAASGTAAAARGGAAMAGGASSAYSLASAGCEWLPRETERVMQVPY